MQKSEQEHREFLRRKLKRLTKTPDWISDPLARLVVHQIRSELYPHVFNASNNQFPSSLIESFEPPYNNIEE